MPVSPQSASDFGTFNDALDDSCNAKSGDLEEDLPLSWRLDPGTSLSDWVIVVVANNKEKTYHVHKIILSVGPRKSDYFARLFRNRMKESATSTSRIVLEEPAASAFESMLDFQYNGTTKLSIETATALRYLSQYFGIRKLFTTVTSFIRINMSRKNAPRYLLEAAVFHDENLMAKAAETCAQHIVAVDRNVLISLDAELFLQVLSAPRMNCTSDELSCIVASFCHEHEDELDEQLLGQLTQTLTSIDRDVSLYLLELAVACSKETKRKKPIESLERLQELCIESSSRSWQKTLVHQCKTGVKGPNPKRKTHGENLDGSYAQIPLSVKVELLEKALCVANRNAEAREDAYRVLETRYRSLEEKNLVWQQRYTSYKNSMKREQKALKDDLQRFRRVPVTHSFQNKAVSTYQQSISANSIYGRKRPTSMPAKLHASEEGYVVTAGERRWPVFYYRDA